MAEKKKKDFEAALAFISPSKSAQKNSTPEDTNTHKETPEHTGTHRNKTPKHTGTHRNKTPKHTETTHQNTPKNTEIKVNTRRINLVIEPELADKFYIICEEKLERKRNYIVNKLIKQFVEENKHLLEE